MSDRLLPYETIVKAHEGDPHSNRMVLFISYHMIRFFLVFFSQSKRN